MSAPESLTVTSPGDSNDSLTASVPESDDLVIHHIEVLLQCARALQPFALLRNVGHVEFRGVIEPRYKQDLTDIMQGNGPVDHLPKMYEALQYYVGQLDYYERELEYACEAVEDEDVEGFKRIRARLVARMSSSRKRLFDHDADTPLSGSLIA